MTNEELEACCDRLEAERQKLAQDPGTRTAANKLARILTDLSAILARRDNISHK